VTENERAMTPDIATSAAEMLEAAGRKEHPAVDGAGSDAGPTRLTRT
jgi:hypothetical protein